MLFHFDGRHIVRTGIVERVRAGGPVTIEGSTGTGSAPAGHTGCEAAAPRGRPSAALPAGGGGKKPRGGASEF